VGLFSSSLSTKEMALLCHNLSTLYESGVTISRGLKAMEESGGSQTLRGVTRDLRESIEQGATFGQAAHWHQKRLTSLFVQMVGTGEQSGGLGAMLPQLSKYYEDLRAMYLAVIRQTAYPAAVLLAILAGIPILKAFLSDVAGIANASFETQLYWILRDFTLTVGGAFFAVLFVARLTFKYVSRESILMYCWPLSGIVRRILISRFAWAMMVFTRAGLPLDHAVRLSGQVTGARRIARDFENLAPLLREGHTLGEALAHSRFLPKKALVYVNTGEITGKLDECFEHLSKGLYDEAVFKLRVLIGLIEPLAILALGAMVVAGLG
jgi:general secretion pathway protein F